ncbi:hypothetical protein ACLB2K_024653 [Fragaria x ananassa]
MDSYETLTKNLDKDLEDLEQLIAYCNIWENQKLFLLKDVQDIMSLLKNLEDELERVKGMRRRKGYTIIVSLRVSVRLIKTIGEMEKAPKALDPNKFSIFNSDIARQQLGYARQEANRKLSEMGFWAKAAAWCQLRNFKRNSGGAKISKETDINQILETEYIYMLICILNHN